MVTCKSLINQQLQTALIMGNQIHERAGAGIDGGPSRAGSAAPLVPASSSLQIGPAESSSVLKFQIKRRLPVAVSRCSVVAMAKSIRVSDATWTQLRMMAAETGGRLQAITEAALTDGLARMRAAMAVQAPLGVTEVVQRLPPDAIGAEVNGVFYPRVDGPVGQRPSTAKCPSCGCAETMHQQGGGKNRCERHPACRWAPVMTARSGERA
jgi:hypothetical protein